MDKERLVASARRYLQKGKVDKAILEVEKLVAHDAQDMRARLELADLHERRGDKARAVALHLDNAKRYAEDGFSVKALGVYLHAARLDPRCFDAYLALGRHYAEQGLLATAAGCFDRALATLHREDGGGDEDAPRRRLEVAREVLELDPDNVVDRVRLAEGFLALGLRDEGVAELRRAARFLDARVADADYQVVAERLLHHEPGDVVAARKLAVYYVAREEPQRALAKLKVAFEAAPRDREVLDLLADAFNQLGQVHKSVAVLKEMARLYDESGLIPERDDCYARILMLDPNDKSIREALGESSTEAEGQTLEFYPQLAKLRAVADARASAASALAAVQPVDDLDDDFDFDFDPDDDDDEIGFGVGAENTIVDDAFIPEEVRGGLESPGLSLSVPGEDAPAASPSGALQEDLRELDFYLNNGLLDEARALLVELVGRHGPHPLLDQREQRLQAGAG